MNPWRPYPLLRLVFPFIAGIVIGIMLEKPVPVPLWVNIVLLLTVTGCCRFSLFLFSYRFRWVPGAIIYTTILIAGFQLITMHTDTEKPGFVGKKPQGLFLGVVDEPPVVKGNNYRLNLCFLFRQEGPQWVASCGRAQVTCKIRPSERALQHGDMLLVHGSFEPVAANSNPNSFNYSAFLASRGITHQGYLGSYQWKLVDIPPGYPVQRLAFVLRNRLLDVLCQLKLTGREFGVAAALLLGYTGGIDPELRREYSATGAMHILSVSGMHVGIIYLFLDFILGFLGRNRRMRFFKTTILIGFIWFYALLTGLSPSVFRAATMLSFVIAGRSFERSPDMFNILAASLFLIISTNPFLLMDIGFQLSYCAVSGIVLFYKPIYELVVSPVWIFDKIWSVIACSLAATIATLPLTLFAFHQFPNYFLLTNIAVVPLSSLIIYAGIIALALSPVSGLAMIAGSLLSWLVWLLNTLIHGIEGLPFSTIRGIFLSFEEMILLYVLIGTGFLFFQTGKRGYLWVALLVMISLQISFLFFRINRFSQNCFITYNVKGCLVLDFITQDKACLVFRTVDSVAVLPQYVAEIASNIASARGVKERRVVHLEGDHGVKNLFMKNLQLREQGDIINFGKTRIALLRGKIPHSLKKTVKVDYLVITGNPDVSIRRICSVFNVGEIIIDGTNSRWRTRIWCRDAGILGIKCHPVAINGAFVKEF